MALLFPLCWPEPFGMVMIEAMACGTPVLAFQAGAVSEVIDQGVTGVIVEDADQAIRAVRQAVSLDRRRVRRQFEERFSARRMARDYVRVYRNLPMRDAFKRAELGDPVLSRSPSARVKRNELMLTDVPTHAE